MATRIKLTTKKCGTALCPNNVRTNEFCVTCTKRNSLLHKCASPDCARRAHKEFCATCINVQKRAADQDEYAIIAKHVRALETRGFTIDLTKKTILYPDDNISHD